MHLSTMAAAGLAIVVLAGCASQHADQVGPASLGSSESISEKKPSWLRLLLTAEPVRHRQADRQREPSDANRASSLEDAGDGGGGAQGALKDEGIAYRHAVSSVVGAQGRRP